jgi:hypothetical protein
MFKTGLIFYISDFEPNLNGSTSKQAVESNIKTGGEELNGVSISGTLNNASCLGNGPSTVSEILKLESFSCFNLSSLTGASTTFAEKKKGTAK